MGINNNGLKAGSVIGFDTSNSTGSSFTIADNIADSTGTGAGSLGLTKLGANTLVLSGTNSYSGVTTVNAGILSFSKVAALYNGNAANWTAANITVNSGGTLALGVGGATGFTTSNVSTLLANLTTGINNNGFKAGSAIGFDTTAANFTVADVIADSTGIGGGSIGVTKLGTNTLTLSGNNTYTGGTTVAAGTLNVSGDNSLATGGWNITGTVNFQTGSTINVASGKSISLSAGSGALTSSGTVVNDGSLSVSRANTVTIASGTWTQNGAMSVSTSSATAISSTLTVTGGSFTYAGPGVITLRGSDNSGGGSAFINVSGLAAVFTTGRGFAAVANTVGAGNSSANVTLDNGGTMKLSANVAALATAATLDPFNFKVGSTGTGGIIDTNGFNTTLGVVVSNLSGAGKLTKAGEGTLTLSNTNTYTGATTVSAGTLLVSGSIAGSAVAVNGGTFGGTGSTSAPVTVAGGASLLGGDGATATEDFALSGDLTLQDSSMIKLTLGAASAHSTLTRVGGTWTFDGDQAFSFIDAGATAGVYDNIITGLAGDPGSTAAWTILNPAWTGTFAYDGAGNVDLTLVAVPEPGAAVSLLGGLALLVGLQRRRRH